jgi:predicted RNA-binding protein with PUA domain
MEKFEKQGKCPQDAGKSKNEYHKNNGSDPNGMPMWSCTEFELPHMHRTCKACGYEWAEEPLA